MNKRTAYAIGKETGFNIASWLDLPEIGSKTDPSVDYVGYKTLDDVNTCADYFTMLALDAEQNARQFSPFEFTAQEFNDCANADSLWDEYDRGVSQGIKRNWQSRKQYYN